MGENSSLPPYSEMSVTYQVIRSTLVYPLVRTRALSGYVFLGRDIFKCLNEYLVNVGGKKQQESPLLCFQITPVSVS